MNPVDDTERRLARIRDDVESSAILTGEDRIFLEECLGDPRKNLQRAAAECFAKLVRMDRQGRGTLLDALQSSQPRIRWGAAFAMSLLGEFPPVALDTAIELLDTDDRDLRWAAADLLKRADQAAMDRLCETARTGTFLQRRMALYALRDLAKSDPRAIEAAYDAVAESDIELRLAGLATLTGLSKASAVAADRIIDLLDDPELRIQRAAAAALGSLGCRSPKVIRAIERALVCPDESVRRAAKKSLERIDGHDGIA